MAHQVEVAQDSHPSSLDKQHCTGTWKEIFGGGLFNRRDPQMPGSGPEPRGRVPTTRSLLLSSPGRRHQGQRAESLSRQSDKAEKDCLTQVPSLQPQSLKMLSPEHSARAGEGRPRAAVEPVPSPAE